MDRFMSGVAITGLACLAGCAHAPTSAAPAPVNAPLPNQPIAVQMLNVAPELRGYRFNNVLNFEGSSDRVFLSSADGDGAVPPITPQRPHTGRSSLQLEPGASTVVRLSTLLGDHAFPDDWTLVGAYFYSEQPARVQLVCSIAGAPFAQNTALIPAGQWTAVMVDLTSAAAPASADASLSIHVDGRSDVWCDDVVTVDNTYLIVGDPAAGETQGAWSVRRRGLSVICENLGSFRVKLDASEGNPDGWTLEEASPLRARFSSAGRSRSMTIYADGRSYRDGKFVPLSAITKGQSLYAQQQDSPAQIDIPETMGRLERRSAGDENNDGYNEARGSYMIVANGPRLAVKITPRSVPVLRPVLEVKGLPPGDVLVTVEGLLVEQTHRLDDGTLLVDIPTKLDRPTTVTLRVQ
jgi:hypothetical protein